MNGSILRCSKAYLLMILNEWILPYRTVDEDFVGNKPMLRSIIYDKLFTGNAGTIYEVIENYKKYVRWQKEDEQAGDF